MATLAEMLVGSVAGATQNAPGQIAQGAQLAQTVEQIKAQRQDLAMKKEALDLTKIDKVVGAIETGLTKVPKKAQMAYFKSIRDNVAGKLGVGLSDEFFDALTSPDVNQGALGQYMVNFRESIRKGMSSGDFTEAKSVAPQILEAFGGDVSKFGEFMNTAMGSEANALAQSMQLEQKQKEYSEAPQREQEIKLRTELSKEAAGYDPSTLDANISSIEQVLKELKEGKVQTKTIGSFAPGDQLKKIFSGKLTEISNKAKKAIQASLKQTLGAQFTKEEGERVESRTFDPQLSVDYNIGALEAELQKIKESRENKENLFRQYKLPFGKGRPQQSLTPQQLESFNKLPDEEKAKAISGYAKKFNISNEEAKKIFGVE